MDLQLMINILHMSLATLLIVVVLGRGLTLFKGTKDQQPSPALRKLWVALQHFSLTAIALTGLLALYLKDFQVEPWFYAKVVLFVVMISSLIKTYKKDEQVLLVQRRGGFVIALGALVALLILVVIKPSFG